MSGYAIRGTTPDYVLTLDGVDLTGKTVYVTIKQTGTNELTLTGERLTVATDEHGSAIAFSLTQQDTLNMSVGQADVQVKFIDANGHVESSDTATIRIGRALLERVIEYADGAH